MTKYYDLPDKVTDENFLAGTPIYCTVTLASTEVLEEGELIVIKLSDKSKYKGKVLEFTPIQIGKYKVGEATIVRVNQLK